MAEADRGTLEIRVMTPASWIDLDLEPATRVESIDRLLDERAAAGGMEVHPAQRAELAGLLERTAADAQARGGIFASVFSDVLEGRPVSATLMRPTRTGGGYLITTAAGRVVAFGDAPVLGDVPEKVPGYRGGVVGLEVKAAPPSA